MTGRHRVACRPNRRFPVARVSLGCGIATVVLTIGMGTHVPAVPVVVADVPAAAVDGPTVSALAPVVIVPVVHQRMHYYRRPVVAPMAAPIPRAPAPAPVKSKRKHRGHDGSSK